MILLRNRIHATDPYSTIYMSTPRTLKTADSFSLLYTCTRNTNNIHSLLCVTANQTFALSVVVNIAELRTDHSKKNAIAKRNYASKKSTRPSHGSRWLFESNFLIWTFESYTKRNTEDLLNIHVPFSHSFTWCVLDFTGPIWAVLRLARLLPCYILRDTYTN